MKQLSILITLLISLGLSSTCWGEVYNSLKVPNHKNIRLIVQDVEENFIGVTTEKIELATKLGLLRNGIKTGNTSSPYFLYVGVEIIDIEIGGFKKGSTFHIKINLEKIEDGGAYANTLTMTGGLFLGTEYKDFEQRLNFALKGFLLNYLESNME
jgi:hypothetical protein